MEELRPNILFRIFFSLLIGFFACIPTYIAVGFTINLFGVPFDSVLETIWAISLVYLIALPLALLLWLVAWRTLRWGSGRTDCGLLPSFIMKVFAIIIFIIGITIIVVSFYAVEYHKALGGFAYAIASIIVYQKQNN